MANIQITPRVTNAGFDPNWKILRSEREDDDAGREILANSILRLFTERPGTYVLDPNRGFVPSDYLGKGVTADALARIPLVMEGQIRRDERVQRAQAVVEGLRPTAGGVVIVTRIYVVPKIGEPFALTLGVSEVTVSLLKKEDA